MSMIAALLLAKQTGDEQYKHKTQFRPTF